MSVWFLLSIFRIIIPVTASYQNNNKCVCSRIFHCLHPSSQTYPEVIMLELHWHIIPMETELGVINMALWLLSRRRQMGFWHWICKIYLKTQMSKRIAPRKKEKKKKKKKNPEVNCWPHRVLGKDQVENGVSKSQTWTQATLVPCLNHRQDP